MTAMNKELYTALLAAGTPEDKASLAASSVLESENRSMDRFAAIAAQLNATEGRLTEKIAGLDAHVAEKITSLDARIAEKIASFDIRMTERINAVDVRLTERINGIDVRLTRLEWMVGLLLTMAIPFALAAVPLIIKAYAGR